MKKQISPKHPIRKPAAGARDAAPAKIQAKPDRSIPYAAAIVVIACFMFYGNTLNLKYAYDDLMVITGNQFVKQGAAGIGDILTTDFFTGYFGKDQNMVSGGRYRPLSLVTFALEYQVFGENPMESHLLNVLLFTAVCILLLILLAKFMVSAGYRTGNSRWYLSAPLLITLLFAGHPVHTEVVANIKSRDEILALLFCLLTLWFSLKYLETGHIAWIPAGGISFFLAMMSKENSVTFLLIQPVTVYLFTRHKLKKNLLALAMPVFSTIIFLMIRGAVVGHTSTPLADDLMNNPFVEMTLPQKYATILYTLGLYLKLLIFPHPLTSDYYPYHIPVINPADWRAILPLILYLLMIAWVVLKIRKRDIAAWSFFFYLTTLSVVSNVFFPIGAFMNERFLFMPSVGFCILAGAGMAWATGRLPERGGLRVAVTAGIMTVILLLYGYRTVTRNADWYDSYTLFTTDVKVSANSAKGNETAGEYIMQKAVQCKNKAERDSLLRRSIAYQQKAVSIYPKQIIALINLAAAYYEYNRNYDSVLAVYKTILGYTPGNQQIYQFFNSIMGKYDNVDHKIRLYTDLLQVDPERFDVNINLGSLYLSGKGDAMAALPYLEKAVNLNPGDYDAQNLLGTAYGYLRKWPEAARHMELALSIRPGDAQLNSNLAIVYQNLGQPEKAREARSRADKTK
jgi:hypothetical protein